MPPPRPAPAATTWRRSPTPYGRPRVPRSAPPSPAERARRTRRKSAAEAICASFARPNPDPGFAAASGLPGVRSTAVPQPAGAAAELPQSPRGPPKLWPAHRWRRVVWEPGRRPGEDAVDDIREGWAVAADLSQIVKAYDVRGVVPDQWDESLAELFGAAFVTVTRA